MMIEVPAVLSPEAVRALRDRIDPAEWVDGNATSGPQAALAKVNRQLPQTGEIAVAAGRTILAALDRNPLFVAAALPRTILPPLFNRYGAADRFDSHIDNAVRGNPATGQPIRTDLSATLFLTDPADYDGGELIVEDTYGAHSVKLNAGDLVLYPASSLHHVTPITRGERISAFFWIQSLIRRDEQRTLLFTLDANVQSLSQRLGAGSDEAVGLTGVYHNLLRMWSEV